MTVAQTVPTDPKMEHSFGPTTVVVNRNLVSSYVASTGDVAFGAHRSAMTRHFDGLICPPTLLDRDVGTRLAQERYTVSYALHAKQEFEFVSPVMEGREYVIDGLIDDITERNKIKYFTIAASVKDRTTKEVVLNSRYTRAYEFPGARHPTNVRPPLTLRGFLDDASAGDEAFPATGSIISGSPRALGQDLMNLYSGPTANFHTDNRAAVIRGHRAPIAQGLMATSIECALFREVFGECWYTSGTIDTRFIRPIIAGSTITVWAVVQSVDADVVHLLAGSFDQDGLALTISKVSSRL